MMFKYRFIFIICFVFSGTTLFSQVNYPAEIRLNTGWEFLNGDLGSSWEGVRPVKPDAPEAVPIWESDEITFDYQMAKWGKETQIKLSVIEKTSEYAWIEAELLDEKGVLCLDSQKFIFFESAGDGNLTVNQGTSTGSKKVQAYNGKARIKLVKNGGENVVSVKVDGMKTVLENIPH